MSRRYEKHEVKFCKRSCYFSAKKNFFISYPKSGRTWVRFMVDAYKAQFYGVEVRNVFKVERKLRLKHHVEWTHLAGHQRNPYFAMIPQNLELLERTHCVFMIRNFHATLASAWYQVTERLGLSLEDTDSFLQGTQFGVMHIISFYNAWIELEKRIPQVAYISYSNLKDETRSEFTKVLKALDLPIDESLVESTLKMSSFDQMKQLALSEEYVGTPLAPTDATRPESAKVRSATSRGYKGVFSEEQIGFINEMVDRFFVGRNDPRFAECIEELT
jgi:hypothetical protein